MTREESAKESLHFAGLVAAAVVVLTLPRLLTHELWRDEAWLWLVVGDSRTLAEMSDNLARNGQGFFFPLLCFFAKQVTSSPRAMQFVNLVLAGLGAFAFVRWAPLPRLERVFFVLGFLPFYEYAVISRHYAAGAWLLWLGCAAARGSRYQPLGLGLALGLLCQTTVYGFILAIAVAAGWLLELFLARRERPPLPRGSSLAGLGLGLGGALAGLVQLVPEPGTSYAPGWRFDWQPQIAEKVAQMPFKAFLPWPRLGLNFWNTNLLDPWPAPLAAAGALVAVGATVFLWPRKAALLTWLVGAAGLAGFGYIKFIGVLRHDGHWWLLFVAALWLAGGYEGLAAAEAPGWRRPVFRALLLLHGLVGCYASWMDLRHPFSNAARTAAEIRRLGLDQEPLLGYREPPAAPVALALGQPLFFPSRGVYAKYPDWGPVMHEMEPEELRCAARAFAASQGRDIVMVMNRNLPPWPETSEITAILGAIQATEDYHLYRLHHDRLEKTAAPAACLNDPTRTADH